MRLFLYSVVVLFVAFPLGLLATMPQPVGLAASESQFVVGSSTVEGQGTVFEGDAVRTLYLSTRVSLKDGGRYVLGVDSEGTVYKDRLVLRYGSAEVAHKGRPARIVASSLDVAAEKPQSSAIVYLTGEDRIAVQARAGEVTVSRSGSKIATVAAGELASFRLGAKRVERLDAQKALTDIGRVQAEQLSMLVEASKHYTCLTPTATGLSRSFAGLSSQLASVQASRSAIQDRIDTGRATSNDLQLMATLNNRLGTLTQSSAAFSDELVNQTNPFHHGPPPLPASEHTVHGHDTFVHHGQHGHIAPFPPGHHNPFH
ncbi:MAG: hypothetical protein HY238_11050 [Acidobacteria bacterium]|nr:hypothetical protein [Acidobacteriota bacterium]